MPRLDEMLKAAGEPTRLRILNLLRQGNICVCDLQAVLRIPQPTISRHLAALRHAGLVVDERNGTRIFYSLVPAATPAHRMLLRLLAEAGKSEPQLRQDLRRLRAAQRRGQWHVPPSPCGR